MNDAAGLMRTTLESYVTEFFLLLPNLAIGAVVLGLFVLAAWLAGKSPRRFFWLRDRADLAALLAGFLKWGIIGFGLLVVATIVFPSVKPADVLATLGIGSVAIGFAFKDILQNWFAGLLILLRQPFRQGDQIVVNAYEGTVEHIEARATLITTYDGRRVVIPNSDVYTRAVIVNTAFSHRRSEYSVGIGYGDDVPAAQAVILEALRDVEGVLQHPAADVLPWELDGSSVNLKVRWWTDSKRSSVVHTHGRVIAAVKAALSGAGIDLPFPTRVVLLHDQTEETDGDRARQREGWPAGDRPPAPRVPTRITIAAERSEPGQMSE